MPLLGEQVTPALPRRGRCSLFFLLGSAWGAAFMWMGMSPMPNWTLFGWSETVWRLIVVSAPVLAWAVLWSRFEQRPWVSARLGAVFGVGTIVGVVVVSTLTTPALGYAQGRWFGPILIGGPILALVGAAIGGLVALVARFGVLDAIPQTDPARLCWRCGYDLGLPSATRCTECGSLSSTVRPRARRRFALVRAMIRAGPIGLLLAVLIVGGVGGYRAATEIPVLLAFERRFSDAESVQTFIDIDQSRLPTGRMFRWTPALGRLLKAQDAAGRRYLVSFALNPRSEPLEPTMQVRIAVPAPRLVPQMTDVQADWGVVTVVADLDEHQAERVLRDGLPPGLLEALSARADAIGWTPTNTAAVGGLREVVDPAPFFPPEP